MDGIDDMKRREANAGVAALAEMILDATRRLAIENMAVLVVI